MSKCRQFLEGLPHFDLVVDHNPLVPILNDYVMDNRRLLRLRLKMQRYAFTARWMPGKKNVDADALSRAPSSSPSTKDQLAQESVSFTVRNKILATIGASDVATLDREGQGSNSCRPNNDRTAAVDYLTIMQFTGGNAPILAGSWPPSDRRHRQYGRCRRSGDHSEKLTPTRSTRPATVTPRRNQATPVSSPDIVLVEHGCRHHQRRPKLWWLFIAHANVYTWLYAPNTSKLYGT